MLLDSNIWISAILFGGNSEAVLRFCLARVEIVASEDLAEEIFDYFRYQIKSPQKWRRLLRITFEKICTILPSDNDSENIVRDPKDNHIIAAAVTGKCRFIVTGDKDLLGLGTYKQIRILTPADFLHIMPPK